MWVYTGTTLVNIAGALELSVDRDPTTDRLIVFSLLADFPGERRVALARVEVAFASSLIVPLGEDDDGLSLADRSRAQAAAQRECEACLAAIAAALSQGKSYCDISALYRPVVTVAAAPKDPPILLDESLWASDTEE